MLTITVHPEAKAWAPSERILTELRRRFPVDGIVQVLPRRMVNQVHGQASRPYAFRAFTRGDTSYVFTDGTETPDSVAWVIAHELSHQLVDDHPEVAQMLDASKPQDLNPAGDRFHQVDAEERLADGYATRLVGKRYDRAWWRKRAPER